MSRLVAGCDLGKSSAGFVLGTVGPGGGLVVEATERVAHGGRPFEAFRRWYVEREVGRCAVLAATGVYGARLSKPVVGYPEEACREAGLERDGTLPVGLNLLSFGAHGYGVLTRAPAAGGARTRFQDCDKCSSGAGENIERMASRFGVTIEEADAAALAARGSVPVTARCSVFAKSEMTHYANEGRPAGELFRGYFESVARNACALLARNRVDGPVLVAGGCTRIGSLVGAIERVLGEPVRPVGEPLLLEALGAAVLAAGAVEERRARLPAEPGALVREPAVRFGAHRPAREWAGRVTRLVAEPPRPDALSRPLVLGLDLGSTGAKAVLADAATGEQVFDVYDRTRGNPVDAAQRLARAILGRCAPDVRAIGVTGSGREAVATLLRAVFGEGGPLVVLNEIVAHATAAAAVDPDRGADLSIVEIGGQDAKYIRLGGGRIVESDLNKACSAGTGSFLEEQAHFHGVDDIGEFVRLAGESSRPADLGQMCTVYIADAASEALKDGFGVRDVFAGFQYSILHNYLHRVMGQRTLAARVFFQGKPASNPTLAWTLAAVTGRDIVVPPDPGSMGAWGIARAAIDELGRERLGAGPGLPLARILDAAVVERTQFPCREPSCATMCPIDRTVFAVGGETRAALSGGACPRYESAGSVFPKLERDAPDASAEVDALVASYDGTGGSGPRVAIPYSGAVCGVVAWLAAFVRELGLPVRVVRSGAGTLAAGERMCRSFDSCGPVKIAHALGDADAEVLLLPKILEVDDGEGSGGHTCVNEQAAPELVGRALAALGRRIRVASPVLSFGDGSWTGVATRGSRVAAALIAAGVPASTVAGGAWRAAWRAEEAQRGYEAALEGIGRRTLEYAGARGLPVVVVCGSLHVVHDEAINARIPALVRRNGALAVPADCYPTAGAPALERVPWGDARRALRVAVAAGRAGTAFPVLISSFGCGPASFVEHSFGELLRGHPHTILESDGHGGAAGFVTRIQAFLQSVKQQLRDERAAVAEGVCGEGGAPRGAIPARDERTRAVARLTPGRARRTLDERARYVFPSATDNLGAVLAAVYRSHGLDAAVSAPIDERALAAGREDCSGKECLSYQLLWGSFRRELERRPPDGDTRLMQLGGDMCRAAMFSVKDAMSLDRLGLGERVSVQPLRLAGGLGLSTRLWLAIVVNDLMRQIFVYGRGGTRPGAAIDPVYAALGEELVRSAERPGSDFRHPLLHVRWFSGEMQRLAEKAARAFPWEGPAEGGTVFVSGDVLTKGNDFANGGLYAALFERGVRAIVEPNGDTLESLAADHEHLVFGRGMSRAQAFALRRSMRWSRRRLYEAARRYQPWLPLPDVQGVLARPATLDRAINGTAPFAVRSVLYHWERLGVDGIVMANCWGCCNGLIEESVLRHEVEVPCHFHYDDGTPLDERRLDGFVFRLGRRGRGRERRRVST